MNYSSLDNIFVMKVQADTKPINNQAAPLNYLWFSEGPCCVAMLHKTEPEFIPHKLSAGHSGCTKSTRMQTNYLWSIIGRCCLSAEESSIRNMNIWIAKKAPLSLSSRRCSLHCYNGTLTARLQFVINSWNGKEVCSVWAGVCN